MNHRTRDDVLRAVIEQPHIRRSNGENYLVYPKLVTERFGDGRELLILTPCVTSVPNYYVVRTGTGWTKGSRWGNDSDAPIRDHLDDIYEAIREEFGEVEYEDQGKYHDSDHKETEWPLLDLTIGCSWGVDEWPFYPAKQLAAQ
jgi:hypothetical protein